MVSILEIRYNLTGSERKTLVNAIGEILESTPKYQGAPTFAYNVDGFVVDKKGTLGFDDRTDSETVETLIEGLERRGFTFKEPERAIQSSTDGQDLLIIEVPKEGFTNTAITNLYKLIESKSELIKKALGTEKLTIEMSDKTLSFPWFQLTQNSDEVKAYTHFISALCAFAKTQKRVNAVYKPTENEKYTFRCFLLRLGFIGDEFKAERKILLKNLTGSSALKNGFLKKNKKAVSGDA